MIMILSLNSQQDNFMIILNAQVKIQKKYVTFSVPIKKYHYNDKTTKRQHDNDKATKKEHSNGKKAKKNNITMVEKLKKNMARVKKRKTTTCRLKFIDSYRFTQYLLSTLVDNLSGKAKKESCNKFTDTMRFMTD